MHSIIFGGQLEDLGMEFDSSKISIRRSSGGHKIATFLRQQGYDVEVLDYVHRWSLDQLKKYIEPKVTDDFLFFGHASYSTCPPPHAVERFPTFFPSHLPAPPPIGVVS